MDYYSFIKKINQLKNKYDIKIIGRSHFKRKIIAVEIKKDNSFPTAILVGGVHAREHITTSLLVKMLDCGIFDKLQKFNVSIIPMANPDGVELCTNGIMSAPRKERKNLLKINSGNLDFSLWKANGKGVDINNNFSAGFGENQKASTFSPNGFCGENFESEPESFAIAEYTRQIKPFFTVSYHSKGEELYFNYFQNGKNLERDSLIAEHFAKSTGYVIKNPENSSSGGYKDYCVSCLKIPAITLEVGNDVLFHPIGEEFLKDIFESNKFIYNDLDYAYEICKKYNKNFKFQYEF